MADQIENVIFLQQATVNSNLVFYKLNFQWPLSSLEIFKVIVLAKGKITICIMEDTVIKMYNLKPHEGLAKLNQI